MYKRKITGAVLAATLAFGSAVPAFAADITISDSASNASYSAYRLLNLTTSLKDGEHDHAAHDVDCYNYSYTVNGNYANALKAALNGVDGVDADGDEVISESEIISYLASIKDNAAAVRTFADNVWKQVKNMTADESAVDKTFSNVNQGYYLIVETQKGDAPDAYSLVMLDTAGQDNIEVKTKESVPTVSKSVQETSDDGEGAYGEAADADIGDHVKFKLEGTMPENIDAFKTYKYVFHDDLQEGLTFDEGSVVVKIDNVEVDSSEYTVKSSEMGDNCDFEVAFEDIKAGRTLTKDSKVEVTYTATLGESAGLKTDNSVKLEFSANPYFDGEGDEETSETPPDTAVVFTYTLNVDKITKDEKPLAGANFKVQKWNKETGEYEDYVNGNSNFEEGKVQFVFKGLDAGKYKLVETKVPDGYNAVEPIEFEIRSELEGKEIKSLETDSADFTAELSTGTVATKVVNETGSILPSTGGAGTYLIYGLGALLAVGGATIVVTRRKKTSNSEN